MNGSEIILVTHKAMDAALDSAAASGCEQGMVVLLPNGKPDPYVAPDGKHYWNCWTANYRPKEDGFIIHAWCDEDKTGRALCGVKSSDGGGMSFPREGIPGCIRCRKTMEKRGALSLHNVKSGGAPE